MGHEHRVAGELEEHRQDGVDRRGITHHRRSDTGEPHDLGRNAVLRVYQGGEFTEHRAAAYLDRPDFGDRVRRCCVVTRRAPTCGFQVDHDEGGLAQGHLVGWGPGCPLGVCQVGETQLSPTGCTHGRDVRPLH